MGTLDAISQMLEVEPYDLLRVVPSRTGPSRTASSDERLPSQVMLSVRVRRWLVQEGRSARSLSVAAGIPLTTMYRIIDHVTDVYVSRLVLLASPSCLCCAPWELISPSHRR